MRFLDIDEVVANAIESIDSADLRDRIIFRQWAYIAMRQIGCSFYDIYTSCIDICDFSFKKPNNLISTIDVSLKNTNGLSVRYKYAPNRGFLCVDETTLFNFGYNRVILSEDSDFYHLSSNSSGINVAEIKYYGLPIDANGDPRVPEKDLLAVMSFIEYMYIKRKRISTPQSVAGSDLELFRDIWTKQLTKSKGSNKMPSMHQGSQIAKEFMSMINRAIYKN